MTNKKLVHLHLLSSVKQRIFSAIIDKITPNFVKKYSDVFNFVSFGCMFSLKGAPLTWAIVHMYLVSNRLADKSLVDSKDSTLY